MVVVVHGLSLIVVVDLKGTGAAPAKNWRADLNLG